MSQKKKMCAAILEIVQFEANIPQKKTNKMALKTKMQSLNKLSQYMCAKLLLIAFISFLLRHRMRQILKNAECLLCFIPLLQITDWYIIAA